MIEFVGGDILNSQTEAVVNTVNCVGVMGRGIALQFKQAYPENFKAYAAACARDELEPGRMFVFETGELAAPRYIINFPTKRHWRGKSRIEDIEAGLEDLARVIRSLGVSSVAIPPLGSGLGGLDWADVRPRIEQALAGLDARVVVFEPAGAPESDRLASRKPPPPMTAGRAALVELMQRYLAGLMDPYVSLLELHKLMYFMQEAGQPLKLRFKAANYGPYAENLSHVLHAIEGYFVSGFGDGGDAPDKQLSLVPGASRDASRFLAEHPETRARFDRVAKLVEGFESPFGLELLSTVHWLITQEHVVSPDELVARTHTWNSHKQRFTPRQIGIAADALARHGWVGTQQVVGHA